MDLIPGHVTTTMLQMMEVMMVFCSLLLPTFHITCCISIIIMGRSIMSMDDLAWLKAKLLEEPPGGDLRERKNYWELREWWN